MDRFTKYGAWLSQNMGVRSIDWAQLAAEGTPGVRSNAYIKQYLSPAFVQATVVWASLDVVPGTTAQVLADYAEIKERFGETADSVLKTVGTVVQLTNPALMATVSFSAVRNLLWYLREVTIVGINSQLAGMIHRSRLDDEQIAYHASLCTMSCNLFVQMDKAGMLKPWKKGSTSGLGALPAGALVAIAIGFVIACAWAAICLYETYRINNQVDAACNRALQSKDPADQAFCQQLREETKRIPNPGDAVSGLLEKVSIAAMVGAGLWMLVQFGPGIATKLKQSVSAWKAG